MGRGVIYRYSLAFQQKVVGEVEAGRLTVYEAQKMYGIKGSQTIQKWLKKLGKEHLLSKVVRVEMKNEKDKIKALEQEKRRLESALAQTQIKVIALESLVEVAEEHYKTDFKKNFGPKLPKELSGEQKQQGSEVSQLSTATAARPTTNGKE